MGKIIEIDDLWVGDLLRIKNTDQVGSFIKKLDKTLLLVRINQKKYRFHVDKVELYVEEDSPLRIELENDVEEIKFLDSSNILDLHMEQLNPEMKYEIPQMILNYQIKACEQFVKDSIALRKNIITIIHGKGKGQLKNEVLHILSRYEEISHHIPVNNDGAREVWFKYI